MDEIVSKSEIAEKLQFNQKAEAQAILDYTRLIAEINNSEIEEPDRTAFISTISELISDELNHQEKLFKLYVALSGIEPNKD